MANLRIEIQKNWRGKFDMRIGDIEGSSTSSNITKQELLQELSTELDDVFLFDGQEQEKNLGTAKRDSAVISPDIKSTKLTKTEESVNKENNTYENVNKNVKSTKKPTLIVSVEKVDADFFKNNLFKDVPSTFPKSKDMNSELKEVMQKDYENGEVESYR